MFYKQLAEQILAYMVQHAKPFDEPTNYSRGKIGILIYLQTIADGATPGELSQHFGVSTGRIATALKGLEEDGMLERRTDQADKRKVTVHLREKGRELLFEKREEAIAKTEKSLSKLEQEEALELVRLVKKLFS